MEDAAGGPGERRSEALGLVTPYSVGAGFLMLVLGVVIGFPVAIVGAGYFAAHADTIAALVFGALIVIAGLSALIALNRRRIWEMLFRISEVQLQNFAGPLADAARHVAEKHPEEAAEAARRFAQIALARWAWISTRRWIIASITGLVAALAALAGTALLFQQNELLVTQIKRLEDQNRLIDVQIQLAEAARSAGLIGEISRIADELGKVADARAEKGAAPAAAAEALPSGLRARIVAATQMARPYRFVALAGDNDFAAGARNRPDIPDLARIAAAAESADDGAVLVDRPLSPERGQILHILLATSITDLRALNFANADFSHAMMAGGQFANIDFSLARFDRADASGSLIGHSRFQSASMNRARFRGARIFDSSFAADQRAPSAGRIKSSLIAADLSQSVIARTKFEGAQAVLARFDGAVIDQVSFSGARLTYATFRDAVLLDADFSGADLTLTDFSGAVVTDKDWLEKTEAAARPGTFRRARWLLSALDEGALARLPVVAENLGSWVAEEKVAGRPAWRVIRTAN